MTRRRTAMEQVANEERPEALESMIQEERANTRADHISYDRAVECTRRLVHLQELARETREALEDEGV